MTKPTNAIERPAIAYPAGVVCPDGRVRPYDVLEDAAGLLFDQAEPDVPAYSVAERIECEAVAALAEVQHAERIAMDERARAVAAERVRRARVRLDLIRAGYRDLPTAALDLLRDLEQVAVVASERLQALESRGAA